MTASTSARVSVASLIVMLSVACQHGARSPDSERTPKLDSASAVLEREARATSTGASGVISEAELSRMRVTRVEQLIAGRFPGVQVGRAADGGYAVLIRGAKSFGSGNGEPLYVIDGMALPGRGLGQALTGIAPQDIARIEVLKDAGATAPYGSQGANGVILITTKRHR